MQYLVVPIMPASAVALENGLYVLDRKQVVKEFYTDRRMAQRTASELAQQNPGSKYGVFAIAEIVEALPAKLIYKRLNDAGEIVLMDK